MTDKRICELINDLVVSLWSICNNGDPSSRLIWGEWKNRSEQREKWKFLRNIFAAWEKINERDFFEILLSNRALWQGKPPKEVAQ